MFPNLSNNGYHPIQATSNTLIAAICDIYHRRNKRAISIKEYRKII